MAILIEDYRQAEGLTETDVSTSDQQTYQELCQTLGLSKLAESASPNSRRAAGVLYPPLPLYELRIWSTFLPTRYSKYREDFHLYKRGRWSTYAFDAIPSDALTAIRDVDEAHLFDDLQIWTPERIPIDPMVVGVLGTEISGDYTDIPLTRSMTTTYHPIMRWGEALVPFVDVERRVQDEWATAGRPIPEAARHAMRTILSDDRYRDLTHPITYRGTGWIRKHCGQPVQQFFVRERWSRRALDVCARCHAVTGLVRHTEDMW